MQNYGASHLAASWRTVRKNTVQVAEDIPADKYDMRAADDTMTVGQMLAHLACSTYWVEQAHFVRKMDSITGEDFGAWFGEINSKASALSGKEAIVAALKATGESYATGLESMTPAQLDQMVTLPGTTSKSRFEMLLGVKEHEMHHRAQLMQLERMMGIVPHVTRARQAR